MQALAQEATGTFKLRKKKDETPSILCVGYEQRVRDMQEESGIKLGNLGEIMLQARPDGAVYIASLEAGKLSLTKTHF